MTEDQSARLIEAFLNGELSSEEVAQFRRLLKEDAHFRQRFSTELGLQKCLDPGGEYQWFKRQLEKVKGEFFGI